MSEATPGRSAGRPTKFREEHVEQIRLLAEAGVTDVRIAALLRISRRTISRWQASHPELFAARKSKHGLGPPPRQLRFREEYVAHVRRLCELGVGDQEIAGLFCVHVATLRRWRREHMAFGEAVKAGRAAAPTGREGSRRRDWP